MADDVRVCDNCGKVLSGPDTGQHVPNWNQQGGYSNDEPPQQGKPITYKGQPITHGRCEECGNDFVAEAKRRHAERQHIWFRKPGEDG